MTVQPGGVILVSLFFFFFADRTDIKSLIRQAVVHGVPAKLIDYISPYGWKGWERITVRYRLIFKITFFLLCFR